MSVTQKDKKLMQENWDNADEAGGDLPDGTYQFQVTGARFHMTDKQKPTFKTKLKVVGGAEEFVGKELEINDNLETSQNMGFFKKKLRRLNIAAPEDIEDITDGEVADSMKGKTFEGQVKTKNDFMNVYVNRLTGESSGEESDGGKEDKEDKEEAEEKSADLEEGDTVTWNGKTGEVVEIIADDNKARVKKEDGSVVRVALNLLEKATAVKEEKDEEEDEKEEAGEFEMPTAEEAEDMKMPKVKEALTALGLEPDDIKSPREVLHAICILAEDEDGKIELDEVSPLASALDVTVKKGASFKDTLKALSKAVQKLIA